MLHIDGCINTISYENVLYRVVHCKLSISSIIYNLLHEGQMQSTLISSVFRQKQQQAFLKMLESFFGVQRRVKTNLQRHRDFEQYASITQVRARLCSEQTSSYKVSSDQVCVAALNCHTQRLSKGNYMVLHYVYIHEQWWE